MTYVAFFLDFFDIMKTYFETFRDSIIHYSIEITIIPLD